MRRIGNCSCAVVGGAGFLGSHLVDHLIEDRDCQVAVIDNLVVGRREFIHPKAEFIHHDITGSEDFLREVFKQRGVQFVFNYAAWPYIPDSFQRPLHVFNVNATAAIKVINAAQEAGCDGILQVSSAEIYGDAGFQETQKDYNAKTMLASDRPKVNLDEDAEVRPHSTYGAAKAAVDYYCQTAWRERQTPVIALRQFNVIGPRETHSYILPEIISQLSKQEGSQASISLGNDSFRDFQYAGDAVRMATELLEKGHPGEVYNMGSEGGIKIYDLARLVGKVMGFKEVSVLVDPKRQRPWEIWHLQSDNTKLYATIEARPTVSLEGAIERTVDWFRSNGSCWSWERPR